MTLIRNSSSSTQVCDRCRGHKLSWSLVVGVASLYEMLNQWNPSEVYNMVMVLQDER
ncbi:hypothetical protein PIB30_102636, partial [Stylosanthes scabra]|nr:hypothetical protein [Stylosanthes scabra]